MQTLCQVMWELNFSGCYDIHQLMLLGGEIVLVNSRLLLTSSVSLALRSASRLQCEAAKAPRLSIMTK